MITSSIIKLLLDNQQLAAIVGNRIRPNIIKPNEVFPAMYVSAYRMQKMGCDNASGVQTGILEIGVHALEYRKCAEVIRLVRETLDDFSGFVGNVGISILQGEQTADDYDETGTRNIQVIEYEAYAEIKN
jgi:hypothetical protein